MTHENDFKYLQKDTFYIYRVYKIKLREKEYCEL